MITVLNKIQHLRFILQAVNAVMKKRSSSSARAPTTSRLDPTPTLYCDAAAPPARFVLTTARHLGVQLHLQHVDLFAGEHATDAYKKVNPLQKVPALVHSGLTITDSHAIAIYLCEWSQNLALYPAIPDTRAKINQLLFYNSGVLFPIDSTIMSEYFAGKQPLNEDLLNSWTNSLDYLEYNLKDEKWLCGNDLNLSDLCCGATVSSMCLLAPLDGARHGAIREWIERLGRLPCYVPNTEGLARLAEKIRLFRK